LRDGEYRLGSADDCDLVLSDASVAPEHLRLVVQNGAIRVEAADSSIVVDGRPLESGQTSELSAEAVIGVGTTVVAIGTAETDWSSLSLPPTKVPANGDGRTPVDIAPGESGAAEQPTNDDEGGGKSRRTEAGTSQDPESLDHPPAAETDSSPIADATDSLHAREEKTPGRWSGRRPAWIVLAGVVLAVAGLVTIRFIGSRIDRVDEGASRAEAAQRSLRQAKKVVAASSVPDIAVSLSRHGTVIVEGYTPTATEKLEIIEGLSASGIEADDRIWPIDRMMSDVRDTLDRLGGTSLRHTYVSQGTVALEGYYSGSLSSDELTAIVRDEVPALRGIQSAERTLADATADLRTRIRDVNLTGFLTTTPDGSRIAVEGVLDPDQMKAWMAVRDAFQAENHGLPDIESRVQAEKITGPSLQASEAMVTGQHASSPQVDFPRLQVFGILGLSEGPFYALVNQGTRIRKGDKLNGVFTVEEIRYDRVILRDRNQLKTYLVGSSDD